MKKINKLLIAGLMIIMGILIIPTAAHAKSVKVAVNNTAIKRPAILKKAKKVTIKNSKKAVVKAIYKKNNKDRRIVIKGKKKGTAKLTVKCKLSKKKIKKLVYKVKVVKPKEAEKQQAFGDSLEIVSTSANAITLTWEPMDGVQFYRVERKDAKTDWEKIGITTKAIYQDYTVEDGIEYSYRVRARLANDWTEYSNVVTAIAKNKIPDITSSSTPEILPTASPSATPEATITPTQSATVKPSATPYISKYTYEVVEVLNKFNIYEDVPIVLYVKTDNPNPNDFDEVFGGVYVSMIGDSGSDYSYGDIQYVEQEETNDTFFNKVKDGWVVTVKFKSAGKKNVSIEELDKSGEENEWRLVDTFEIEVKDGAAAEQEYCDKVIAEASDDNYNADGRGKWSELSDEDKINRLEDYITAHYAYPRYVETIYGNLPVRYIQENVGAYWETGYADCGAANHLLQKLAQTIGFETKTNETTLNGGFHINAIININGEEKIFDATPTLKKFKDWDYIL